MELTRIDLNNTIQRALDICRLNMSFEQGTKLVLFELTLKRFVDDAKYTIIENNSVLLNVKEALYSKEEKLDLAVFEDVAKILEEKHKLPKGIFNGLLEELERQKNWSKVFSHSMDTILEINTVKNKTELKKIVEKMIAEMISYGGVHTGIYGSNKSISSLMQLITDVQKNDNVLDGTIGFGVSALACLGDVKAYLTGIDINRDALAVTAMYIILSGNNNVQLFEDDFLRWHVPAKYDKITMDIPFNVRIGELFGEQKELAQKWCGTDKIKVLDWLMLAKTLELLKEDGKAVIMVPQSITFKTGKYEKQFKENLIKNNLLSVVISLPPVYTHSGVRSSIFVFEHNKNNTLIIDLDNNSDQFFVKERKSVTDVSESGKILLKELLKKREEIPGISRVVAHDEIAEKEFDLTAAKYILKHEEVEYRSIKEIEEELEKNYVKLEQLIELGKCIEQKLI